MTDRSDATEHHSGDLEDIRRRVDTLFVTEANTYGCAETAFVLLKELYGLPDPDDSSAAMALNGGVAYEGSVCGAISGAALAVGQLAGRRISDHAAAKRSARMAVQLALDAFVERFGAIECRTLTGFDLRSPGGHDAFLAAGVWRTACADQVAFMVDRLAGLASSGDGEDNVAASTLPPGSVERNTHARHPEGPERPREQDG